MLLIQRNRLEVHPRFGARAGFWLGLLGLNFLVLVLSKLVVIQLDSLDVLVLLQLILLILVVSEIVIELIVLFLGGECDFVFERGTSFRLFDRVESEFVLGLGLDCYFIGLNLIAVIGLP